MQPGTVLHLMQGDQDGVMPIARTIDAASTLRSLGAWVTLDAFPGLGHGIDARVLRRITDAPGRSPRLGASIVSLRSVHLRFEVAVTTLSLAEGSVFTVGHSPEAPAEACFRRKLPTAIKLERAIDVVEDALMAAKVPRFGGTALSTFEPALRQLPGPETVGATLSRDEVETLFQQLASIALGMPDPTGGMVAHREVAAALLIIRVREIRVSPLLCTARPTSSNS